MTDNGRLLTTVQNAKDLNYNLTTVTEGVHLIRFKAESGAKVDTSQSFTYVVSPNITTANPPVGMSLGANLNTKGDSLTLLFQAPNKQNVFVIGSFNDYKVDTAYLMRKSVDGKTWWLTIKGLTSGQTYTYQYLVDGTLAVADPLSILVLDPSNDSFIPTATFPNMPTYPKDKTNGIVSVIQTGKTPYDWKIKNFQRPAKKDLIIYELLIRDFIEKHDYQTLIDTLSYFKNLGITAIELMPVCEFDGNLSWGYNPSFHNALDKYYGTPEKFKEFIDKCHENGIAVIIDVVFNHASGNSPYFKMYADGGKPAANSPYMNVDAPHPYSVFNDFNHESEYTRNYVNQCLRYWLKEYNIDGYRFDLSKGLTQTKSTESTAGNRDQSRINIIKEYHNTVQTTSPNAYTILEHFADNAEETEFANAGMMVWANSNFDFNEATMGWTKNNIAWASAKKRGWNDEAKHDKHIAYMESHDEERLMVKNILYGNASGNYSVKSLQTALKRIELASVFFYAIPGPRMLWQFGELGYDIPIDQNGRTGNKPILWNYFQNADRKSIYNVTRNIIHLRKTNIAFRGLDYTETDLNEGYYKAFHVKDANLSVTVLGNFDVVSGDVIPNFQSTGKWYNYLTGDSITVTNTSAAIRLLPGEYRIYTSKKLPTPPAGFTRFTSTKEFAAEVNDFQIYPNPSLFGTTYVGYNLKKGGDVRWEIINATGQIVATAPTQNRLAGSYQEDISTRLPQGTYWVKLSVNGAISSQKLVVF